MLEGKLPEKTNSGGAIEHTMWFGQKVQEGRKYKTHIYQYSLAVRFLRNKLERGLGAVKYHFRDGSMSVKWFKNNAYFTDIGTSMKWASFSHPQTDMLIG